MVDGGEALQGGSRAGFRGRARGAGQRAAQDTVMWEGSAGSKQDKAACV